ncbi:MAG: DNA-3-methyladenine glycosylase [Candidatus Gracilibacteria bacterium]
MFHSPVLDIQNTAAQIAFLRSKRLRKDFYKRDTLEVLSKCLGKLLVTYIDGELTVGRITEAEAYLGHEDKAAHSYNGRRTARTAIMFEEGGYSYVFVVHTHMQFNFVTQEKEIPQAILVRGIEPVIGTDIMQRRRQKDDLLSLGTGPGKLTKSLGITKNLHYGVDLTTNDSLFLADDDFQVSDKDIMKTTRVGIDYAEDYREKPWRYYIKNSKFISKK